MTALLIFSIALIFSGLTGIVAIVFIAADHDIRWQDLIINRKPPRDMKSSQSKIR